MTPSSFSIIIPAYNEEQTLPSVLAGLEDSLKSFGEYEIVVVDDGSQDGTANFVKMPTVLVQHPVNRGHGAAIKSGLRVAKFPIIIVFDADGQHDPKDIPRLLMEFKNGYDLVVGNRKQLWRQHNGRGNSLISLFASFVVGQPVPDLTSGLRVLWRDKAMEIIHLVPDRFCFELTSTVSFALMGYKVKFMEIYPRLRQAGQSKIRIVFDGFKFGLLILRLAWIFKIKRWSPIGKN